MPTKRRTRLSALAGAALRSIGRLLRGTGKVLRSGLPTRVIGDDDALEIMSKMPGGPPGT